MTKAKARRMAVRLEELAADRNAWLATERMVWLKAQDVRRERDFFLTLAADLRLLSEGKRLPQKRKASR